ncbi:hypothetical protein GCM10009665_39250 [Kitasatospora nipponensis]|uniref:Chitin-binding type-3 domain-containing protein n=1 Tax=Kitasatospora nipponensis TaxID=258049 RepID=A0ABN1WBK5_9ACTN
MSRRRITALLLALVTGLGLATLIPATSFAAGCAAPWSASTVYTGGLGASYNGHNWSAKWWTQGEAPSTGGSGVWADQGTCDSGTPTPPPGGGGCTYPAWAAGTAYTTGSIVTYTNGGLYIATHDNPGYDPTISTWYWSPYTCTGGGGGTTPPPIPADSWSPKPSSTRCSPTGTPSTVTPA